MLCMLSVWYTIPLLAVKGCTVDLLRRCHIFRLREHHSIQGLFFFFLFLLRSGGTLPPRVFLKLGVGRVVA